MFIFASAFGIMLTFIILQISPFNKPLRRAIINPIGALAQLIERGIRIAEVAGLIPARSTIFLPRKNDHNGHF